MFGDALRGTGPDDATIAAGLAAQPVHRWRRLFEVAGDDEPKDLERGDEILALVGALVKDLVFDWRSWIRVTPWVPSGPDLDDAPVADAARLAVAFVQRRRFDDAALRECVRGGALRAIVTRLRRWFEGERGASAR
nr:DUF6508 domain-containing protein [Spiractinospora alimapuensis]